VVNNDLLLDDPSQARGSGRFAWQHEALVVSLTGREKAPRLILRRSGFKLLEGLSPADAARAHRPEPRATNRDFVKAKVGKNKNGLTIVFPSINNTSQSLRSFN